MIGLPRGMHSSARRGVALLLFGLLFAAPAARAIDFETHYGVPEAREEGRDVKSVRYCSGGGSILAGTRVYGDGSSKALVTRVADNGTALWQYTYLATQQAAQSSANAVVELNTGKGFALTGAAIVDSLSYIYVLQIDCDGKPAWTTLLQNLQPHSQAVGYDIIQPAAQSKVSINDLVVVGDETIDPQAGVSFGRIASLTAGGGVIWNRSYARPDARLGLRFRAVTGNVASSGDFSDLVVAGSAADGTDWSSDRRALMFRVDSAGTPICDALLGGQGQNGDFFGLTRILADGYHGGTVLVGAIENPAGGASNGYLAYFYPGGCQLGAQTQWPNPLSKDGGVIAYDAVEVHNTEAEPGSVVVTGTLSDKEARGFLLTAKLADLTEDLPPPRLFGARRQPPANLLAIDTKGDHVVLAGSNNQDWAGSGDPQDFYFVETDSVYATECSLPLDWRAIASDLSPRAFRPEVVRIDGYANLDTEPEATDGEGIVCEPSKGCTGVIDNGTVKLGVSKTGYLNVKCYSDKPSSGRFGTNSLVGLRLMSTDGDAAAPGLPCEGWGVASADLNISGYTSLCAGTSANMTAAAPVYGPPPPSNPSFAKTVVKIGDTFRVTHDFNPTPITPYLYQVNVTIENIGRVPVSDLRYSRGVDYDVPPNGFSEYITIKGSTLPPVWRSYNNGFNSPNPLAVHTGTLGDFTDLGAADQGAHFDFKLGALKPGAKITLVTFYGAADDERLALAALSAVGANIYSLGQSNWDCLATPAWPWPFGAGMGTCGASTGRPGTYMYGVQSRKPAN